MPPESPTPIEFPVPFADVPEFLYFCITSRDAAAQSLGKPMLTSKIDGIGAADFWALRFTCGLMLTNELPHSTGEMRVVADSPELSHTLASV